MVVKIDFETITNKEELYKVLKEQVQIPNFYGDNLDALWDVFSIYDKEVYFKIKRTNILDNEFANYLENFMETIKDLSMTNQLIKFEVTTF